MIIAPKSDPSHQRMVARTGSIIPLAALIPAGIMTTSEGKGIIEDSMVMRINISRYPIDETRESIQSTKCCIEKITMDGL